MKFSYNWLKEWVKIDLSAEKISHPLTMSGLEIEELTKAAPYFTGVVIAQVLEVQKHPNADKLNITKVDIGEKEPIQIVCGAPNVKVGIKVPCALSGALLPNDFKIKPTKMRGEVSNGMLCSGKELGIPDDEDGLLVLDKEAPIGLSIRDYLKLDDDILELKITPNRADCLSIKGIAREVNALTKSEYTPILVNHIKNIHKDNLEIINNAQNDCGQYTTRVIKNIDPNIKTPRWIKEKLERSDIRSIGFLVDIGNYVMLELGQPLHIFDFDQINSFIEIRKAKDNEKLLCLNNQEVTLNSSTLIIADKNGPLSIAGLMGGLDSSVTNKTKNILIESAFFYPHAIVGQARHYGFSSESSYRFERGVDHHIQLEALNRASELIIQYAGGDVYQHHIASGKTLKERKLKIRLKRAEKLLGIPLDKDQVQSGLSHLGFDPAQTDDGFIITVPSFRFDLNEEIDIIEEICRIVGYENIPADYTSGQLSMIRIPEDKRTKLDIARFVANLGYYETINYAFVHEEWEKDFTQNPNPIYVKNPISSEMTVMRSTLIPSLINVLNYNLNRKQSRVRLFEIAKTFIQSNNQYQQEDYLAVLAYGSRYPEQYDATNNKVDFYDLKNDLERLLENLNYSFQPFLHPALHPGKSAKVLIDGRQVGYIGEIHPKLLLKYNLNQSVIVFEVKLNEILSQKKVIYSPISKFQSVRRDLAFIMDEKIDYHSFLAKISENKDSDIRSIEIFDLYKGSGLPEGKKSIAIKVLFQSTIKTLEESEIEKIISTLIEKAKSVGAMLRI